VRSGLGFVVSVAVPGARGVHGVRVVVAGVASGGGVLVDSIGLSIQRNSRAVCSAGCKGFVSWGSAVAVEAVSRQMASRHNAKSGWQALHNRVLLCWIVCIRAVDGELSNLAWDRRCPASSIA